MQKVKVKEASWLARLAAAWLRFDRIAIVLGETIYLHNAGYEEFIQDKRWVSHELKHIEQYRRHGHARFALLYCLYSLKYGYFQNPFEKEARAFEHDYHIINSYELFPLK